MVAARKRQNGGKVGDNTKGLRESQKGKVGCGEGEIKQLLGLDKGEKGRTPKMPIKGSRDCKG